MDHIAKAAHKVLSTGYAPPQHNALPTEIIDRVWTRMAEIYGHKWTSNYGASDSEGTWAKGLADMSNTDLKRGFFACLNNGEAWPPSLPEFRALCKAPKRENSAMYALPASRQLPHKLNDDSRSKGREMLAALKAGLRA